MKNIDYNDFRLVKSKIIVLRIFMKIFFDYLKGKGYKEMEMPEAGVDVFYSGRSKSMNAFCFVDADVISIPSAQHYAFIKTKIQEAFDKASYKDYKLIMIFSSKDINSARKCAAGVDDYWLINSDTRRLIIYDNQPQESGGMRYMLEHYLETGEVPDKTRDNMARVSYAGARGIAKVKSRKYYLTISNIIIAVNIIVFIIVMLGGDVNDAAYIESKGGLTVDGIKSGEYYRMFTSLFLHFGATHLFYNMLFIFSFGNTIEPFLGKLKLALVYFGGGLGGSVLAYIYNTDHNPYAVTAGASGAAYALMGGLIALAILVPEARRQNNPLALIVIAVLFISEGFTSDSNVANSAHIGGIVFGFIIAFLIIVLDGFIKDRVKKTKA